MSYSKDVFFKPWVGLDYPYGWCLDTTNNNNKIVRCTDCTSCTIYNSCANKNKSFKVMVLGLEHYCKNKDPKDPNSQSHPAIKSTEENDIYKSTGYALKSSVGECLMHLIPSYCNNNKCSKKCRNFINCPKNKCAHLFACKGMTEDVIKGHIFADKKDKWIAAALDIYPFNAKSHAIFEKICTGKTQKLKTQERKDFWNSMLFSNFFQRGMPNPTGNGSFHISTENDRAFKAFENIVNIHKPNIVFVWGDDIKDSLGPKVESKCIPFLRTTLNLCQMRKNYNILLDYIPHTSPSRINRRYGGKKRYPSLFEKYILPAFETAENLRNNGLL